MEFSENLKKHFLQIGDILIVAKGASFLSAVYDGTYAPAVASTVFLVIKIRAKKEVLPAFISWYLNLPSTQSELMNEAKGTSVHSINKSVLQNLEIPLLTKAKQEKLLQIIELRNHERQIEKRIEILKEKKMSQLEVALSIGQKSSGFYSHLENYKHKKHFNLTHLLKLSVLFDVDIYEFIKTENTE
jgi:restriction endonuclease S subunit